MAALVLGSLLAVLPWRTVFFVAGGVAAAVALIVYFWLKDRPLDVGLSPLAEEGAPVSEEGKATVREPHFLDTATLPQACLVFALSARVWLICFGLALLTSLVDFFNFIPIYLRETSGISPAQASMAGAAFPTGMLVALVASGIFYDRLSRRPSP